MLVVPSSTSSFDGATGFHQRRQNGIALHAPGGPLLRLAVVQTCATRDRAKSQDEVARLIRQAAADRPGLIALPENWAWIGPDEEKLDQIETEDGPSISLLKDLARSSGAWIMGGTVLMPGPAGDPRAYNTALVVSPEGELTARYQKIHLFDVEVPGGAILNETKLVAPGQDVIVAEAGDARLGLSVCYDLRFSWLYREMAHRGANLLCVPAAFTVPTGSLHWEILLRARAIETLSYVIAPAQAGRHSPTRRSWGHSMIVDPYGGIVAQRPEGAGVLIADLDLARVEALRATMPILEHDRGPRTWEHAP